MNPREILISKPATGKEEWNSVREPIESGWLAQGPKVKEFEKAFASYQKTKHGIATSSGTASLHLLLAALDIGPGDEVIVPAFTWISVANVVLFRRATPVFVDVDPTTYDMDPEELKKKITKQTKAVIVAHLFGLCADMDRILEITGNIPVIEDAACAAGSTYKGRSAGSIGIAGAFSFHARKVLVTGEGGMITTNDSDLSKKLYALRDQGASYSADDRERSEKPYLMPEFNLIGFNYRMTDLQGAIGLVQLRKLDSFIAERRKWADFYCKELSLIPCLKLPYNSQDYGQSWQAFVCLVKSNKTGMKRDEIMKALLKRGVHTRPGTHAIHTLGLYKNKFNFKSQDFPNALACAQQSLAIPLHNRMTQKDFEYVVSCLKELSLK